MVGVTEMHKTTFSSSRTDLEVAWAWAPLMLLPALGLHKLNLVHPLQDPLLRRIIIFSFLRRLLQRRF